jgi:hypothetical protein
LKENSLQDKKNLSKGGLYGQLYKTTLSIDPFVCDLYLYGQSYIQASWPIWEDQWKALEKNLEIFISHITT